MPPPPVSLARESVSFTLPAEWDLSGVLVV